MARKTLYGLLFLLLLPGIKTGAQSLYGLKDGRNSETLCTECEQVIEARPKEVLFGIHVLEGQVYFSITSKKWFDQIIKRDADGITADIVAKDQFACNSPQIFPNKFPRGIMLKPVYRLELLKRMKVEDNGVVLIPLGPIPASLKNKQIEGNFVVIRNTSICYYLALAKYSINETLIKRMIVNYYIVLSEINMKKEDYDAKDSALALIRKNYIDKNFNDHDLLSIGKFFCLYAQYEWADLLLASRIDKLDVDEDLLFFYLNLSIFTGKDFDDSPFRDMLLNAISINNDRFCRFFNSISAGGISMQLLMQPFWKDKYCENCSSQGIKRYTLR